VCWVDNIPEKALQCSAWFGGSSETDTFFGKMNFIYTKIFALPKGSANEMHSGRRLLTHLSASNYRRDVASSMHWGGYRRDSHHPAHPPQLLCHLC